MSFDPRSTPSASLVIALIHDARRDHCDGE
jgi:hypothetical protein